MSSRTVLTMKNAFWSYYSMFSSIVLQFISRTVFIYYLGENYLGINGLFSNVLGVLSFAELGIGTAINFSLYKPVAEKDIEKIKSYMFYYKWAYRWIAFIIAVFGLVLIPFLNFLVKVPDNINHISLYYCLFLFNTVTSYLVSYKYSLVNAEQKNYIYTNINLVISALTIVLQTLSLFVFKSYTVYLLVLTVFECCQKIFISRYFNKLYPYLEDKNVQKLSKEEEKTLITKVKALIVHKIGEVSVHQTDNIIISAFVNTAMVGVISNYTMLINTVSRCINVLFNSVTGSLGNLIATESKEHQYDIFCKYRFLGFWFYGFTSIALAILVSPFIRLWLGERMVVDPVVINLILINYYMIGQRICLNNFKSAAGVYEQDKYVALIQAAVNLVVSIALVKIVGVRGVYIGTIAQGTISTLLKPILSYKTLFGKSSIYYFKDSIKYVFVVLLSYVLTNTCCNLLFDSVSIQSFCFMGCIVAVIPNLLFAVFFYRSKEFKYYVEFGKKILVKRRVA